MFEEFEVSDLVNKEDLEKIALAQKVGQFLTSGKDHREKMMMQAVAKMLAADINASVRAALAFEVRKAPELDTEIAEKIALDIRDISEPFLSEAICFTDEQLADLIPRLDQQAQITVAKRKDLKMKTVMALVSVAGPTPVTFMIRTEDIYFPEKAFECIIRRFDQNQTMMDHLSRRADLPLSILEELINRVSMEALKVMVDKYDLDERLAEKLSLRARHESLCRKILTSTEAQVHTYALTLKEQGKLSLAMVLDLANRGSQDFMISSLAVLSELTKGQVKEALMLVDKQNFVSMMHKIKASDKMAKEFLRLAKAFTSEQEY